MSRENIDENTKRRLYAESMGRCMNPDCQIELFKERPANISQVQN